MTDRPNLILLTCDQLRAFNLGCYGDSTARTPSIDRLAEGGTRFELAVSPNPVCTPARSCWLSGQYSRTCAGMLGNVHRNPPAPVRQRLLDPTLPEALRDNGYRTALIGKWHVEPQPQLVGFDTALYPMVAHRHYGQRYFDESGRDFIVDDFGPDWEFERVREFLAGQTGDRPFFLNLNISPPHQPIGPGHLPETWLNMFDPNDIPLRPNATTDGEPPHDRHWFSIYRSADYFWQSLRKGEQKPEDIAPADFTLRDLTALYYGAISYVDHLVGKLLTELDTNGLAASTIVLFTSDHGDNLGSHGCFNKGLLIEESIRVPLIVFDPRRPPRVERDTLASLVDVMPTLLDLAGLEIPDAVQGVSLFSHSRDAAFIETNRSVGIRTATHLYGLPFDQEKRQIVEGKGWFFDLSRDPYELTNLFGTGVQAEVARGLHERLLAWDRDTEFRRFPPPMDGDATMADQLVEERGS